MQYRVEQGCTVCGMCLATCPVHAIQIGPGGAVIDQTKCKKCGRCYNECASEAIIKVEENENEVHVH